MEAVVFVGGVSLGQPATSIPIAAIVGIVCGLVCGYLIYTFASRTSTYIPTGLRSFFYWHVRFLALTIFLVVMTNFILLIGAGLFSKAIAAFQDNVFNKLFVFSLSTLLWSLHIRIYRLGVDVTDLASAGNGPGSYDVHQNVWHLDCCNPQKHDSSGWTIFGALFGWSNNATIGSVLGYVFYWLAAIVTLIFLKFKEVNTPYSFLFSSK